MATHLLRPETDPTPRRQWKVKPPSSATYPGESFLATEHDPFIPNLARDANILSAQSGNWSDTSTWSLGRVPQAGDVVGIKTTHEVIYDVDAVTEYEAVGVAGILAFITDGDTQLWCQTLIVYDTGELRIGTQASPVEATVTAEIVFTDTAIDTGTVESPGLDPAQYGNGLVTVGGKIRMWGAAKTPFVRLGTEPAATDTSLTFGSAVSGWRTGDILYLPDSRQLAQNERGASFSAKWEYPVLDTVAGNGLSSSITAGLSYDHPGARDGAGTLDYLPHVANLTRNIILRSENANGVRGHVFLTGRRADIDMRHVLILDSGRTTHDTLNSTTFDGGGAPTAIGTNQIGRYGIHIHHVVGPTGLDANTPQWRLEGIVVRDTSTANNQRWAITIHDSHYGLVKDSITEHYSSWGIGFEEGNEDYNEINGNFIARTTGPNVATNRIDSGSERGVHGRGLYLSCPRNRIKNNVIVNTGTFTASEYGYGISYFGHAGNAVDTSVDVPTAKGSDTFTGIDIRGEPLLEFSNNEVYGSARGIEFWFLAADSGVPRATGPSTISGLILWHIYELGQFAYYNDQLTIDGWVFRGDFNKITSVEPVAFIHNDYLCQDLVFDNCDVQGAGSGITLSTNAYQGSVQTIQNSNFRCYSGAINCGHLWSSGGDSDDIPARPVEVINCTFTAAPGQSLIAIECSLPDPATVTSAIINWVVLNTCKVYDYQGNTADDFQIWFDEQDGDFITPETVSAGFMDWNKWTGATVADQTNDQNWAAESVSVCGSVRPTSGLEARTGIAQQVTDIV